MKLSNNTLKKLIYGAYQFKTNNGYLGFYHYSDEQIEYLKFDQFFYDRSLASSSITIELITDSTKISFNYLFEKIHSCDTIDLYVDGVATKVIQMENLAKKGVLEFDLTTGFKKVTIYMPIDSTITIKNFTLNGKYRQVKKKEKVLFMGDSITQGYGTFFTSHTYVNVVSRKLNYDVINQGIGGYVYDANVLMPMENYKPDKIILAFGTNHYKREVFDSEVSDYFKKLREIYSVPVLVITPIWRCDDGSDIELLKTKSEKIKEIALSYPNVSVVDGFTLVPNVPEYFPDSLHPNALGGEIYGNNLIVSLPPIAQKIPLIGLSLNASIKSFVLNS